MEPDGIGPTLAAALTPLPHEWDAPYPYATIALPMGPAANSDEQWNRLFQAYSRHRPVDEKGNPAPLTLPPEDGGSGQDLGTDRAWARCLNVARANGAVMAVIETRYYDADYRSEFSAFYSKTFAHHEDTTHRVHFFDREMKLPLWEHLDGDAYLGYVSIRPQVQGLVGRTMLQPPPNIRNAVRTAVREKVHLFGKELEVKAVPFTQQDARLGSCAHAVAWMCHYSAHLGHGEVRRQLMADFSLAVHSELAPGRPLPTMGLTVEQMSGVLHEFHLPALHYELKALINNDRPPEWPARDQSSDAPPKRTCCRYLNSGLSVIAIVVCNRGGKPYARHAVLVCGYTRPADQSPAVSLIINDDRRGPYLTVDHLFDDLDVESKESYKWEHLLAPMPEKVWISGELAERWGALRLMEAAEKAVREKQHPGAGAFLKAIRVDKDLTLRCYATTSNRFKERLRERMMDDPVVLGHYMEGRFPKHIWVVEAINRTVREAGPRSGGARDHSVKCVVGEIVLDATSYEQRPTVLAVRLPGLFSMAKPWDPNWDTACGDEMIATGGQYYA